MESAGQALYSGPYSVHKHVCATSHDHFQQLLNHVHKRLCH